MDSGQANSGQNSGAPVLPNFSSSGPDPNSTDNPVTPSSATSMSASPVAPAQPITSSGISAPAPTDSGLPVTGDIVLRSGNEGRSKKDKRIVILLIVAVGILLAVVLGIIISRALTEKSNEGDGDVAPFDRYATYLLYGTASDTLTGEYRSDKAYQIDYQLSDNSIDSSYWSSAKELLDLAVDYYTSKEQSNYFLIKTLKSYQDDFNFVDLYRQIGDLGDEEFLSTYLVNGQSGIERLAESKYAKLSELNTVTTEEYTYNRSKQYETLAEIYDIYSNHGCISGREINQACAESLVEDLNFQALQQAYLGYQQDADDLLSSTVQRLTRNCWLINNQIRNPIIEEEDDEDNEE